MNNKPFIHIKDMRLGDAALSLSKDRRILLDFVYTCASGKRSDGDYSHSREYLQQKAEEILQELKQAWTNKKNSS